MCSGRQHPHCRDYYSQRTGRNCFPKWEIGCPLRCAQWFDRRIVSRTEDGGILWSYLTEVRRPCPFPRLPLLLLLFIVFVRSCAMASAFARLPRSPLLARLHAVLCLADNRRHRAQDGRWYSMDVDFCSALERWEYPVVDAVRLEVRVSQICRDPQTDEFLFQGVMMVRRTACPRRAATPWPPLPAGPPAPVSVLSPVFAVGLV